VTVPSWRAVLFTPESRLSSALWIGAIVRDADGVLTPLQRSVCPTLAPWPGRVALHPAMGEYWRRVPSIIGWRAQDIGPMCRLGPACGVPHGVEPVARVRRVLDGCAADSHEKSAKLEQLRAKLAERPASREPRHQPMCQPCYDGVLAEGLGSACSRIPSI
jgi:hypothetical protein